MIACMPLPTWSSRFTKCFLALTALLLGIALTAYARNQRAANARLIDIRFVGLSHFNNSQVFAFSGLHIGGAVSPADLAAVANRLTQSKAFESVSYRYHTTSDGISAEFDLVETHNLLPCVFENFVWFSKDEITQALTKAVPFYGPFVPVDGPSMDQVTSTLRGLLQSKGIVGDVVRTPSGPKSGGVLHIIYMSFRVDGVSMPVRKLSFTGASSNHLAELKTASAQLIGREFVQSDIDDFVWAALLPPYLHDGYLRVRIGPAQGTLIGTTKGNEYDVAVTIPVHEGSRYLWGGAHWSGNQVLGSTDLDHLLGLAPRQTADPYKLDSVPEAIAKAYRKRGYIDETLQRKDVFDDATLALTSDFQINEGVQYHMGQVSFVGFPDSTVKKLMNQWRMKPGAVYDDSYVSQFAANTAWPPPAHEKIAEQSKPNRRTATVDVIFSVP